MKVVPWIQTLTSSSNTTKAAIEPKVIRWVIRRLFRVRKRDQIGESLIQNRLDRRHFQEKRRKAITIFRVVQRCPRSQRVNHGNVQVLPLWFLFSLFLIRNSIERLRNLLKTILYNWFLSLHKLEFHPLCFFPNLFPLYLGRQFGSLPMSVLYNNWINGKNDLKLQPAEWDRARDVLHRVQGHKHKDKAVGGDKDGENIKIQAIPQAIIGHL